MSDITCGCAGGALISMENCKNCYYKRIKDDVSTVFCKYRINASARESRANMIRKQLENTEYLKSQRDRQYTMGRPRLAEETDKEARKSYDKYKELVMINEAIEHITNQAMEIAKEPEKREAIIKIEEHLTAKCNSEAIADKLLNKEKSLAALYTSIEEKAKEMITKKSGTVCVALTSEDVFNMVDEYYGIADTVSQDDNATEVNIFDFL